MPMTRLESGKHNCFGHIALASSKEDSQDDSFLERTVMLVYAGQFESMDGPVEVTEDHLKSLVENHNSRLSKFKRFASGEAPLRMAPPLQLDHSTSAGFTVGRVVGDLQLSKYKDEESEDEKSAVFGKIRVLGRENVEKVKDGRWIHVSIGADLESGKLNELSITPFPAILAARGVSLMEFDHYDLFEKLALCNNSKDIQKSATGAKAVFVGAGDAQSFALALDNANAFTEITRHDHIVEAKYNLAFRLTKQVYMGKIMKQKKLEIHPGQFAYVWVEKTEGEGEPMFEAWTRMPEMASGAKVGEAKNEADALKMAEDSISNQAKRLAQEGEAKVKLRKAIKAAFRLSEDKDADDKRAVMKKHLTEVKKMSEDDAEKHLAQMDDDGVKSLAAEMDEHDKKMAAEAEEKEKLAQEAPPANPDLDKEEKDEKEHKFSAEAKKTFLRMAKNMRTTSASVQLQARKANLTSRLSSLRASARITPAEFKKIDLVKLAKENDATVNAVFKTYEDREPVIMAQIMGTIRAETVSQLAEKLTESRLMAETAANMPFTGKAFLKEKEGKTPQVRMGMPPVKEEASESLSSDACQMAYGEVCKMMDSGNVEAAKAALKAFMEKALSGNVGQVMSEDSNESKAQMSALADEVKTLHNQFEELVKLVGSNLGVESAEL